MSGAKSDSSSGQGKLDAEGQIGRKARAESNGRGRFVSKTAGCTRSAADIR